MSANHTDDDDQAYEFITDNGRVDRLEAENSQLRSDLLKATGHRTPEQDADLRHAMSEAKSESELDAVLTAAGIGTYRE